MNKNYPFPSKWLYADLKTIAKINPKFDRTKYSDELGVSFIPMKRVSELTGDVDLSETRKFGKVKKGYTPFQDGDIIFAKITPCMENGKVAILSRLSNGIGFGSTEFHVLRLLKFMPRKYLFYYLIQEDFRKNAKRNMTGSVGQKRVPTDYLKQIEIPFPPLPEQNRIAAKIEELFTKLDAGVEALKQAQAQLKRYSQSVLKAAVEGRLTAEWREQRSVQVSKDELEPAEKLLERILKERREKWESQQLVNYKSKGKKPPKNWQDKYKEPTPPDTTNLPELPEGWIWASLSYIGELNRGKSKHRPRNDPKLYNGDYPFVQTGDIRYANKFISNYSQTYNEIGLKQSRLWPKGTLCITIAANIADTAILNFDACFPDSIVGFIPNISSNIFFIEYFLRTAKENLDRYAPATAQKNINLKILSELLIPLPPKIEQDEIVNELDRIFSVIDKLDSIIDIELKRAQVLRQSILKRAFEGRLVPQNTSDEHASVLLERIRARKEEN